MDHLVALYGFGGGVRAAISNIVALGGHCGFVGACQGTTLGSIYSFYFCSTHGLFLLLFLPPWSIFVRYIIYLSIIVRGP